MQEQKNKNKLKKIKKEYNEKCKQLVNINQVIELIKNNSNRIFTILSSELRNLSTDIEMELYNEYIEIALKVANYIVWKNTNEEQFRNLIEKVMLSLVFVTKYSNNEEKINEIQSKYNLITENESNGFDENDDIISYDKLN